MLIYEPLLLYYVLYSLVCSLDWDDMNETAIACHLMNVWLIYA